MTLEALNERLNELRGKTARGNKVEAMLKELYAQRAEAEARAGELAQELMREQADVDKLTGGFWSVYYAIVGKKRDMLEKERAEVMKASMMYETAQNELKRVQEEIDRLEWEKQDAKNCEREYERVLLEKLKLMQEMGVCAEKICKIEEEKKKLAGQLREVNEAMTAGRRVTAQIDRISKRLDSADGYATWDLFGGGLIADMAKHSYLDEAQQGIQVLGKLLGEFRTELADVSVHTDVQAQVSGFMRFADFFFDGFFADYTVKTHIREAMEGIGRTEKQVQRALDQLYRMERDMKRNMDRLDGEMRALAENGGI